MSRTLSIIVTGRVQHVGFRYFAMKEASALNLTGYVRNMENGDVKIIVSGPGELLDDFLISIRKGPGWARVDDLKIQELPDEEFEGFQIK
ncbi:MAG: acylphosphatase [Bacteroidota bacterium]|nr:acylphosphatase [Bacteroidota bacterium]